MRPYQIISDSSCDIPADLLPKLNIGIVPYYATFDTINYHKELLDLTPEEFYDKVKEAKVFPKTSLPPIQDYIDVFEPYLKEGKDIVCMCLTAKFSGSFQSANNAKQILLETLEIQKQTTKINFTVDSLDFLQHGGRVGKAAAFAGAILNIKPIIVMKEGELFPESKVRGHKKALKTIFDMTVKEIGDQKDKYTLCVIRAEKERQAVAEDLIAQLKAEGFYVMDTPWPVGITIGTHCGPTAVGICYIKQYEKL